MKSLKIVFYCLAISALLSSSLFALLFTKPSIFFERFRKIGSVQYFTENTNFLEVAGCDTSFGEVNSRIVQRLKRSEVFDSPHFEVNVFFTKSRWLHKAHSFFMSEADAFCLWAVNGAVYVYQPYFCPAQAEQLISHELTHKAILDKVGKEKYDQIPDWLNEGYCEFVASDDINVSTLKNDMRKPVQHYDNYLLAVTYLIIQKRCSFLELVNNPPNFESVLKEIEHWQYTPKNTLKIEGKWFS